MQSYKKMPDYETYAIMHIIHIFYIQFDCYSQLELYNSI